MRPIVAASCRRNSASPAGLLFTLLSLFPAAVQIHAGAQAAGKKLQPVVVDVVVTDAANRPVMNLGEQDFQVFENGKKQKIGSFAEPEMRVPYERQVDTSLPPNSFTNANAFPPSSIEIVLLDQMNTSQEDQETALRALRDSLLHKPERAAFAIFTLRSDDPACSPSVYAQIQFGLQSLSSAMMPDWNCVNHGQLLMIQGITEDKTRLLEALNDSSLGPRPAWMRSYPGSGRSGLPLATPSGQGPDEWAPPEVLDSSSSALAELGEIIRNLPGRKGLIWVSDSFDAEPVAQYFGGFFLGHFKGWEKGNPLNSIQLLHIATDRLTEDRVAIYPANLFKEDKHVEVKFLCPDETSDPLDAMTAGLVATPVKVTKQSMHWECSREYMKIDTLASMTGGREFSGRGAVEGAIAQAISDDSSPYVLTYYSEGRTYKGKVRKIRVELADKGKRDDRLAYRRSYFADDLSKIYPAHADEQQVYVNDPSLWSRNRVVKVADLMPVDNWDGTAPLEASLQYGAPESNGIVFTVHAAPAGPFKTADATETEAVENYPSYIPERVQKAVTAISGENQWRYKGSATLAALPSIDTVFLQPYSIEFHFAPGQLSLAGSQDGDKSVDLEIGVMAYDATGKRVNGVKSAIHETAAALGASQLNGLEYSFREDIEIPDRVTVLRFAVREPMTGRVGSVEVPVRSIDSPYRRRRLSLPSQEDADR